MILCLWSPPPPLIKVASNTRPYLVEQLLMKGKGRGGGEGRSVLYIRDVQLAAIWSKERQVFHRVSQHFCNWLWLHQIKKWSKCCVHYSGIPAMFTLTKKRVNRSFLTKPFWSRWPAIGFILFCSWTLTSLSPYYQAKKKTPRIQPSSVDTHTHIQMNEILVQGCQKYTAASENHHLLDWLFCLAFLYGWHFLNKISLDRPLTLQCAKKVVSDSPGLVDFAIGLENSVLNLPDGQAKIFRRIKITKVL